jgi:hypothetical protein
MTYRDADSEEEGTSFSLSLHIAHIIYRPQQEKGRGNSMQ